MGTYREQAFETGGETAMKTAAAVHATPELGRRAITGADALDYIGDLLPELTRLAQLASCCARGLQRTRRTEAASFGITRTATSVHSTA